MGVLPVVSRPWCGPPQGATEAPPEGHRRPLFLHMGQYTQNVGHPFILV